MKRRQLLNATRADALKLDPIEWNGLWPPQPPTAALSVQFICYVGYFVQASTFIGRCFYRLKNADAKVDGHDVGDCGGRLSGPVGVR